jgi:O-methyltransferase involved in polyketide biosynthesis
MYLTLSAFRTTIAFIAAQAHGSGVVFDYTQPREALPLLERLAHDSLSARVQLAGEPFQLFFTPPEIAAELSAFTSFEDIGTDEINRRYFSALSSPGAEPQLQARGTAARLLSAWK